MKILKHARAKGALLLSVAVMLLCAMTAAAQRPTDKCRPASVIPLANEPPAKIVIDPPLAEPLASRGVVVIQYCAENLHFVPVFGTVLRTCTSCRCSAQTLWRSRHGSDTFM
jgi:hypothetical protein